MNICLSAKGIQNIPFEKYEKDFVFIVEGKKIQINRFLADFISPKISKIHQIDPTISSFVIEEDMEDLKKKEKSEEEKNKRIITKEIIEEFIEIGKGKIVEIEETKLEAYEKISIILENEEIFEQIEEYFTKTNEMNMNDSIILLQQIEKKRKESNIIMNMKKKKIIEYLSSHFYEILKDKEKREKMKQMTTDTIYEMINKETLVIEDENELMEFIIELIEKDKENTILLENIIFEMISERIFENLMTIFDLNEMTNEIWNEMKKCFHPKRIDYEENEKENEKGKEREKKMNILKERRYLVKEFLVKGKSFPFINNEKFEGIISYLTKKSGGKIHKNGTIEVTSSSCAGGSYLPENVIDLENKKNFFHSKNEANSWICFDFKGRRVKLTNYTITSRYDYNGHHPHTWVIEGSNDGANWEIIDEKLKGNKGDFSLALQNLSFSIERKDKGEDYFEYLRLRQTGPNSSNYHYLFFTSIEFYGYLVE